jgi:hypothetical protein
MEPYRRPTLVSGGSCPYSHADSVDWWKTAGVATTVASQGSRVANQGCLTGGNELTMKAKQRLLAKPSQPNKVDAYMQRLRHPLGSVVEALRQVILSTDHEIGEEIKWNAPSFFYSGEMKSFDPKEYKRYLIVFNLYQKDCIRLVFPSGARVKDKSGLLEGDYADGRRLAFFSSLGDVKSKKPALQGVIKMWLETLDKD